MSIGADDLYQELIVDHSRRPRNFRVLDGAARKVQGFNPLCVDEITLEVRLAGDVIEDIAFQGSGCAISTASASLLTETVKGKTRAEARELFEGFRDLVMGHAARAGARLGKLAAFSGVAQYPLRVKCATLAWHALRAAIEGKEEVVTTEQE